MKDFLAQSLPLVLPHLLLADRPAAIDRIAKELGAGVEKLLLKYVHYILADVLLCPDQAKVKTSFYLLRSLLQFPFSNIFNFRKMDLVMLLLERLGEGEGQASAVQRALKWVAYFAEKGGGEREGEGEDDVDAHHPVSEEELRRILGMYFFLGMENNA